MEDKSVTWKPLWEKTTLLNWVGGIAASILSCLFGLFILLVLSPPSLGPRSDMMAVVKIYFWMIGFLCATVGAGVAVITIIQFVYHLLCGNFIKGLKESAKDDIIEKEKAEAPIR